MNVSHLIATFGYWAVFGLVASENLGIPLPGETALIAAGVYAGQTHHLSPWAIFAIAAAAAITGGGIGYWIGDKSGYRLVRRYGGRIRLDERKLKVGRYIFDRHGAKVVFFGRFVTVLRSYAAFLAGVNRMPRCRFHSANASSAVVWAAIYTAASYEAGSTLRRLSGPIDLGLGAVAVLVIVVVALVIRHATATLSEVAEASYPGPLY